MGKAVRGQQGALGSHLKVTSNKAAMTAGNLARGLDPEASGSASRRLAAGALHAAPGADLSPCLTLPVLPLSFLCHDV